MGVDAGDLRNAGREDVAVGNFAFEMISLFRNQDGAYFTDETLPSGVGHPSASFVTFGVFFFDYDLDGHLDLFAANGHVDSRIHEIKSHLSHAQRPLLYRNMGGRQFCGSRVRPAAVCPPPGWGAAPRMPTMTATATWTCSCPPTTGILRYCATTAAAGINA